MRSLADILARLAAQPDIDPRLREALQQLPPHRDHSEVAESRIDRLAQDHVEGRERNAA